jgi:hypothetical protein
MQKSILYFSFILAASLLTVLSCTKNFIVQSKQNPLAQDFETIKMRDYTIKKLPYNKMPYAWWNPAIIGDYEKDAIGVIMFKVNEQLYYHPDQLAQKILLFHSSYIRTNDTTYIVEAEKFIAKLKELVVMRGDAMFFYVPFDWYLNGFGFSMMSPWYSGMYQGQVLSAIVRIYQATGKPEYLEMCKKIFNSFTAWKDISEPWVVYVDDSSYYWIEEYPEDDPNHVFNGFVYALFGLYDYWVLTEDETALKLLKMSITTVADHIQLWRVEGGPSKYCGKYNVIHRDYHPYHIEILDKLGDITGDIFFHQQADLFRSDYTYVHP